MNKSELTAAVAKRLRIPANQAHEIVDALFHGTDGILARALASTRDGAVVLAGFGKLEVRNLAARQGRNPSTGAPLNLPPKRVVRWTAGGPLRDAVAAKPPPET